METALALAALIPALVNAVLLIALVRKSDESGVRDMARDSDTISSHNGRLLGRFLALTQRL